MPRVLPAGANQGWPIASFRASAPRTATLGGTARAFTREVMGKIEESMKRIAKGTAEAHGATADIGLAHRLHGDGREDPRVDAELLERAHRDARGEHVGAGDDERLRW